MMCWCIFILLSRWLKLMIVFVCMVYVLYNGCLIVLMLMCVGVLCM